MALHPTGELPSPDPATRHQLLPYYVGTRVAAAFLDVAYSTLLRAIREHDRVIVTNDKGEPLVRATQVGGVYRIPTVSLMRVAHYDEPTMLRWLAGQPRDRRRRP